MEKLKAIVDSHPTETGLIASFILMAIASQVGIISTLLYICVVTWVFCSSLKTDEKNDIGWGDRFVTGLFLGIPIFFIFSLSIILVLGVGLGILLFVI